MVNGSASRSSAACGGCNVSSGRDARAISLIPAGVEGGWGGAVVRAILRRGVEGRGGEASLSLVVVVVGLRFRGFFVLGSAAGDGGGEVSASRLAAAALKRLDRRVAIV